MLAVTLDHRLQAAIMGGRVDSRMLNIVAGDERASLLVSRLSEVMQLRPVRKSARQLLVQVNNQTEDSYTPSHWVDVSSMDDDPIVCTLKPTGDEDIQIFRLIQLSLVISRCIIGQYSPLQKRWTIQRPFRVFVNERKLSGFIKE